MDERAKAPSFKRRTIARHESFYRPVMRPNKWTPGICSVVVLLIPASQAGVLTQTKIADQAGASPGGSLVFTQFDPNLGVLDSVTITIAGDTPLVATVTGVNSGDSSDLVTAGLQGSVTLSAGSDQLSAPFNGSTSFTLLPGAAASTPMFATVVGGQYVATSPDSLLAWTGLGSQNVNWQVDAINTTFNGATSTGSVEVDTVHFGVMVSFAYTDAPSLQYDSQTGSIQFVRDGRSVVIEFSPVLTADAPWIVYFRGDTNEVGSVVTLPLTGNGGFYRVRTAETSN
jgi:hypothetical protein